METCEDCSDFRTTSTESYIGQNKFLEKIVEFWISHCLKNFEILIGVEIQKKEFGTSSLWSS